MSTPEKTSESSQTLLAPSPGAAARTPPLTETPPPSAGVNAWTIATMILTLAIFGLMSYSFYDQNRSKKTLEAQLQRSEAAILAAAKRISDTELKISDLNSDLETVRKRSGITQKELQAARTLTQQIKTDQEKSIQRLDSQLAAKADTAQVAKLEQEAESKLGAVTTDVTAVKGDVTRVKTDLASARQDLQSTRRELLDVHEQLRSQVAKNYGELVELRRKGERDYYEFNIAKKNVFQKVGDINLSLKKADPNKKRYDIMITVDDNRLEKKDRLINEPIQFLVGKDRWRYEIVVYAIAKDRITGYLSTPKKG